MWKDSSGPQYRLNGVDIHPRCRASLPCGRIRDAQMPAQTIITLEAEAIVDNPNAIWEKCLERARLLVQMPIISLTLIFCLVFGVGFAVIADDTDGWIIVAVVVALLFVVVCFDNL